MYFVQIFDKSRFTSMLYFYNLMQSYTWTKFEGRLSLTKSNHKDYRIGNYLCTSVARYFTNYQCLKFLKKTELLLFVITD